MLLLGRAWCPVPDARCRYNLDYDFKKLRRFLKYAALAPMSPWLGPTLVGRNNVYAAWSRPSA